MIRFYILMSIFLVTLGKDFYQILGVSKTASEKEIQKAYHQLAKKYHPDLVREEKKKEIHSKKYIEISNAYEVLKDKEKRRKYDLESRFGIGSGSRRRGRRPKDFGSSGFNFRFSSGGPGEFFFHQRQEYRNPILPEVKSISSEDIDKIVDKNQYYPYDEEIYIIYYISPRFTTEHANMYHSIYQHLKKDVFIHQRKVETYNPFAGIKLIVGKKMFSLQQVSRNSKRAVSEIYNIIDRNIGSIYIDRIHSHQDFEKYINNTYTDLFRLKEELGDEFNIFSFSNDYPVLVTLFSKSKKPTLLEREISVKYRRLLKFSHVYVSHQNYKNHDIEALSYLPIARIYHPLHSGNINYPYQYKEYKKINKQRFYRTISQALKKKMFILYNDLQPQKLGSYCLEKNCLFFFDNSSNHEKRYSSSISRYSELSGVLEAVIKVHDGKVRLVIMGSRFPVEEFPQVSNRWNKNDWGMIMLDGTMNRFKRFEDSEITINSVKRFVKSEDFSSSKMSRSVIKKDFSTWKFASFNGSSGGYGLFGGNTKVIFIAILIIIMQKFGLLTFVSSNWYLSLFLIILAYFIFVMISICCRMGWFLLSTFANIFTFEVQF